MGTGLGPGATPSSSRGESDRSLAANRSTAGRSSKRPPASPLQDPEAARGTATGRRPAQSRARQRHLRRSHAPMTSLKRQASKAERYGTLRDEMRSKLEGCCWPANSRNSMRNPQPSKCNSRKWAKNCASGARPCSRWKASTGDARSAVTPSNASPRRTARSSTALRWRWTAPLRAVAPTRSAAPSWRRVQQEAQAEIGNTEERLTRLQQELQTNRATLDQADADVTGAQQELQQRQQEASAAASSLMEVERQQEQRRDAMFQAVGTASALRNRIMQAEERMAALNREAQRLHDETSAAHQQLESFGGQQGQLGLGVRNCLAASRCADGPDQRDSPELGSQACRRN